MTKKNLRQQFADTVLEVGQEDPKLVILVGDISHFKLQPFAEACPERYYNVGVCEQTIAGMTAGLSKAGFTPVMHTIAPFLLERPFEFLKLDFGYHGLNGNVVTNGSAFDYSNLGFTHHCYNDFALLKSLPNAQIVYPGTTVEFDTLFRHSYDNDHLTIFRLTSQAHELELRPGEITFGEGVNVQEGEDVTLITTGAGLNQVLEANEMLRDQGIDPEILYFHTVWPLDTELVSESLGKTGRAFVFEEHVRVGGLNESILRVANEVGNVSFSSLNIPTDPVTEYGTYEDLCEEIGLTADGIVSSIHEDFFL